MRTRTPSPNPKKGNNYLTIGILATVSLIVVLLGCILLVLIINRQGDSEEEVKSESLLSELSDPVDYAQEQRADLNDTLDEIQDVRGDESLWELAEKFGIDRQFFEDIEQIASENPDFNQFLLDNDIDIYEINRSMDESRVDELFESMDISEEELDDYIDEMQHPNLEDEASISSLLASAGMNVDLIDDFAELLERNPDFNDFLVDNNIDLVEFSRYVNETTTSEQLEDLGFTREEADMTVKILQDINYEQIIAETFGSTNNYYGAVSEGGYIYVGQTVEGYLSNERVLYTLDASDGDVIDIFLISDDFDTYLRVYQSGTSYLLAENDDYSDSRNSGITGLRVSGNRGITIEVGAYDNWGSGSYQLQVSYR